jgi:hypothetical protein
MMALMNQHPKSSSHSNQAAQSLEQATQELDALISHEADALMTDVLLKLRVNELTATLRKQPLDGESLTMLNMLETLVIAGEITFHGFMLRVQNLFPHVFDQIDASLRDKLMAMLQD